jgi:rubrerythrin
VDAANRAKDPVLKAVLESLAHDEDAHVQVVTKYYKAVEHGQGWADADIRLPAPKEASERVKEIVGELAATSGPDATYLSVYNAAREFEQRSFDFYHESEENTSDEDAKHFFRFLAGIEKSHLDMLNTLIQSMLSVVPERN